MLENPEYSGDIRKLAKAGIDFLSGLLRSESTIYHKSLFDAIPKLISEEDNKMLTTIPSSKEVKSIVFSIHQDSSPGPDGFSNNFFVKCWNVVREDVINAVKEFFIVKKLPRSYKATFLALIPIKVKPMPFRDLSISLCSMAYKFIAKILVDRLGTLLPKIISFEQGAF